MLDHGGQSCKKLIDYWLGAQARKGMSRTELTSLVSHLCGHGSESQIEKTIKTGVLYVKRGRFLVYSKWEILLKTQKMPDKILL
jgi:hypothetical protein